jgi:hypothetical protein
LSEYVKDAVGQTEAFGIEVEVGFNGIVQVVARVVGPVCIRICDIRYMRWDDTLFWRADVSVPGKIALKIAIDLFRLAELSRRTAPCPVTW